MTSLNKLSKHHPAVIKRLDVHPDVLQRLNAMGLRLGQTISIIRKAPLKGPIHVRIGTTDLIMRRIDASGVFVTP